MKRLLLISLFLGAFLIPSTYARVVEIKVYGMTCSFCSDSLQRTFEKMKSVSKVNVSLKKQIVRLVTKKNTPSLAALKKAVIDTGFTPTKITIITK
ncbi:MAG: heavy-metal-associated domain-containing protein [Epsilonproteobacteria bacterium]|nr:heavy-metal-associated domain-containing protein [Campylobacterota bacterium]